MSTDIDYDLFDNLPAPALGGGAGLFQGEGPYQQQEVDKLLQRERSRYQVPSQKTVAELSHGLHETVNRVATDFDQHESYQDQTKFLMVAVIVLLVLDLITTATGHSDDVNVRWGKGILSALVGVGCLSLLVRAFGFFKSFTNPKNVERIKDDLRTLVGRASDLEANSKSLERDQQTYNKGFRDGLNKHFAYREASASRPPEDTQESLVDQMEALTGDFVAAPGGSP